MAPTAAPGTSAFQPTSRLLRTLRVHSHRPKSTDSPARMLSGARNPGRKLSTAARARELSRSRVAPASHSRPLSLSRQPWPVTCHDAFTAYCTAATRPSPDHSRPATLTTEAARRLCSAAAMAPVTVVAASPVRPRRATTLAARLGGPAEEYPTTAMANSG